MYHLTHFTTILTLVGAAFSLPQHNHGTPAATPVTPTPAKTSGPCTPNFLELGNLYHHHDINTGDVLFGDTIISLGAIGRQMGASGCSPLWAGGSYDDKALFTGGEYPKAIQEILAKKAQAVPKTQS
jgi:hypothetical protein